MTDIGHEPSLEPTEENFIMADCGHEIYSGQKMYEYISGKRFITMCAECYLEQIQQDIIDITVEEVANFFGHNWVEVDFDARF